MGRQQETDLQGLQAESRSASPEAPLLLRWMRSPAEPELLQDSSATSVWGRSQARLLERRGHGCLEIDIQSILLLSVICALRYAITPD